MMIRRTTLKRASMCNFFAGVFACLRALVIAPLALCPPQLHAAAFAFNYALQAQELVPTVYVLQGKNEDFSPQNGGNIVNTGFIVTEAGVVLIDSGPSRRYGKALRELIAQTTDRPILRVFNTHHHPDHVLGNQAFAAPQLFALPETQHALQAEGAAFLENMYRLNGDAMRDTELVLPTQTAVLGRWDVGNHALELFSLSGHSAADLVLFDRHSGALFTGDLVFHGRAPTTPHADLTQWLAALDRLEALTQQPEFRVLIPGHGAPSRDATPIQQTRAYLRWLQHTLTQAAAQGLDMTEVMNLPLPAEFAQWAVAKAEYRRSVGHLYPALERAQLRGKS